jgi:hypothetical protein
MPLPLKVISTILSCCCFWFFVCIIVSGNWGLNSVNKLLFVFFFGSAGVWTEDFTLLSKHSVPEPPYQPFLLVIFEIGSHFLSMSGWQAPITTPNCFFELRSQTFCPGLALNYNPPISTSWVARIAGVSHQPC